MALTSGVNGIVVTQNDVFRVVQPLVAGNNVITHNSGYAPSEVECRDSITGAEIALRVVAESTNSVTLFVPVAPANPVRISLDW